MKIYTKTGDSGESSLYGGRRAPKDDARFEAVGTVDELNALIGLIRSHVDGEINQQLETVQYLLFTVGSHLATPYEADAAPKTLPEFQSSNLQILEQSIDEMEKHLSPLTAFILPSGFHIGSLTHVARAVCRRAERTVVTLSRTAFVDPFILQYLNRLSDYLFVLARTINAQHNSTETLWKK